MRVGEARILRRLFLAARQYISSTKKTDDEDGAFIAATQYRCERRTCWFHLYFSGSGEEDAQRLRRRFLPFFTATENSFQLG